MGTIAEFVQNDLSVFFSNKIVQTLSVLIIAVILSKAAKHLIRHTIYKKEITSRLETLVRVFSKILSFIIYFFAALQICEILFNVQPTSIIAATGVVGVAVGFGAQSLVKDVIAGFFILSENQFAVGDLVTIEGFTGNISELTLRTTIIRNVSGDLFTIPNGSITKVINHSRCTRGVIIAVSIAYEDDIDNALAVMKQTAVKAKEELPSLTAVPEVLGVTALGDSGVELKLLASCVPGEQFAVERELLRRIKYAFDEKNVNIPYNHIVIVNKGQ